MKTLGEAPEWATELFTTVCKDYNRGLPSNFIWKARNSTSSSGYTRATWHTREVKMKNGKMKKAHFYGEVCIRAGTDIADQKLVLLHELSHHVVGRSKTGRGQGHTIKFWKLAFELYERYGVDLDVAYEREKSYKAKATYAYKWHMSQKELVAA